VDAQETAIPTERIQVIRGEGSDLNERSIETEGSMPFGEDEPVSVEIGWIANVEHREDRSQQVGDGQCRADVPNVGPFRLLEHTSPDRLPQ
jgi:hypothetical protein